MSRQFKLPFAVTSTAALVAMTVIGFVSTAYATPAQTPPTKLTKPSGLTSWSIANARQSSAPSAVIRMAPQSNLTLLSKAEKLGPREKSTTMQLTISLKLRNVQQLKQLLSEVQNPDSAQYHHFLTPRQFTESYGPTQAQVAAVEKFLQQNNIQVHDVSRNNTLIHAVGTTGAFERAFAISINNYQINGRTFLSTQDRPQLPSTLSGVVLGVLGLDNSELMRPHSHFKPLGVQSNGVSPAASPPAATSSSAYFSPSQIATAYDWPDITNPKNGAGVSVAIITADTSGLASNNSAHAFWKAYGLPDHTINVIPVDGDEGATDGLVETLLDMEWSGAMAPGITQNVYVGANRYPSTFTDAYNQFVNDDTSQVMTTSWGEPEIDLGSLAQIDDQIFMQGAAEGISMFAAVGDYGAADIPKDGTDNNADYPSSSLYVTAANGTVLTIAGISGTYGSETAWSPDITGAKATGGAISQVFLQPVWQTGPGVPDNGMRMNSDMALNSGSQDGSYYLVYNSQQGFGGVYGTSAVAPALAALFAVGVSQQPDGASLGQSNRLIYNDVNAGNYATDFHDITSGCNGELPDGSPSCAGVGWDHPTGWGSPEATSFLSHIGVSAPAGTLSGTVKDADGNPIAGAAISIDGRYEAPSGNDGSYSIVLPAGNHAVMVGAFGYAIGTASVSVTADDTTTKDFSLNAAATKTVSGNVTDNSGHDYPLYADVSVTVSNTPSGYGQPNTQVIADAWTNPETGAYSVSLPEGYGYTLQVAAAFDGYDSGSKTVTLSGNKTENFPLSVSDTCSAPGYQFVSGGLSEDFNGPDFPPAGWSVVNAGSNPAGNPVVWELTTSEPYDTGNYTGGTGAAAEANSSENNPNNVPFDTSIVTPPISATSLHGATTLRYKANYREYEGPEALDLDITTDGGTTWTTIRHWTTSYGGFLALPGVSEQLDIGSYLPSSGDFQLRWRYYSPGGFVEYAMIDDVEIGACDPVPGGLVMGQVSDANSGNGILGAHVADGNGTGSDTVENYSDPNLPVGFYLFFDAAGQHTLSASAYNNYASQTAGITLNNNSVVMQNFALKSAQLGVAPGQFTLHVMVNSSATASFALSNTGSASGQYSIVGINAPMPATQESPSAAMSGGTPVIRKPVTNSDWIKGSLMWAEQQAQSNGSIQPGSVQARTTTHVPSSASVGSAWQALAPYPKGGDEKGTDDNTVARDPVTGKLYSMGGNYLYSNTIGIDSTAYVYDPKTDVWSRLPDAPVVRDDGASAFINGKYYVVDGWSGDATASPIAEMDIYDPSTDQWTTGAPDPLPVGGGAGYATLNGSLYIVGGCDNGACQGPSSAVQVYHPYSNSWTQVANYPHTVRFPSCGAIEGMLYCAGGIRANSSGSSVAESDAYVYDPLSNSWSHIAPMFVPLGESLYSAANGLLMVAGGIDGSANLVNETEAYDPQTNSWMSLPNLPGPIMRGGYACGFYQIGGVIGYSNKHSVLTKVSRVLPGYTQGCGILPKASWLTTAPASGTVQAGSSANITFTVDGTGQKANTSSRAYLSIANKSPYGPINVPVTVDWDPQPVALKVSGTADPGSAQKGTNVTFDFTVTNEAIKGDGAATETVLTVVLPASMNFVKEQGSSCSSNAGMVICPIDDLAQGDKTDVVIVAQANAGGAYQVTATATANEPQDSSVDNTTTVSNKAQAKAQTSSSGGGSLGLPILVLLLGLAVGVGRRRRPSR